MAVVLILFSTESYFDNNCARIAILLITVSIAFFFPQGNYFLPLLVYAMFETRWELLSLSVAIPLIPFLMHNETPNRIIIPLFILLAIFLKRRTFNYRKRLDEYHRLRDEIAEKQLVLEELNHNLLEKQDYEIHVATLRERNRIARELHDSIGHVLTSALLQTGAIRTVVTNEDAKLQLHTLQNSLSSGMEQVRSSIHDLHEDSIDLHEEILEITSNFRFCPVEVLYNINQTPAKPYRYALLAIIKEALSNAAKHTNATEIRITLIEHPVIYQMTIRDNGSLMQKEQLINVQKTEGMGLQGIKKRVDSLNGHCVFRFSKGFEIFVSLPKEET